MKIAILGCGNMGMAYANSFLKYNLTDRENLLLVEKDEARQVALEKLNIGKVVSVLERETVSQFPIIILAVKPQDFPTVAASLANALSEKNTVVSIMAGKPIAYLQELLKHKFVIRAMPNTPAQIGMGITAYSISKEISMAQMRLVENLLNSTGRSVFLEDESLLDAVTALSGSGPAYFYYFLKHLIEAGKQMGLEEGVSAMLVKQTMIGAYHLVNNSDKSLDELIAAVASKGGTTEAALSTFNEGKLNEILISGLLNAEKRAKELAG